MKPTHRPWKELSAITVPEWYRDVKLGFYMHWGVYSVPAFNIGRAGSDKYSLALKTLPSAFSASFGKVNRRKVPAINIFLGGFPLHKASLSGGDYEW